MLICNYLIPQINRSPSLNDYISTLTAFMETVSTVQLLAKNARLAASQRQSISGNALMLRQTRRWGDCAAI